MNFALTSCKLHVTSLQMSLIKSPSKTVHVTLKLKYSLKHFSQKLVINMYHNDIKLQFYIVLTFRILNSTWEDNSSKWNSSKYLWNLIYSLM
jgi:hypothetical protein